MNQNEIELRDRRDEELEIDLLELFGYFMTKIWWIILGFLAGALLAGLITHFAITPKYTATAKMYMISAFMQNQNAEALIIFALFLKFSDN